MQAVSPLCFQENTKIAYFCFLYTFFARAKKVGKETRPREKPFSSNASDFSGSAELTGFRPAQTCCTSYSEKSLRPRGFSKGDTAIQRIVGCIPSHHRTHSLILSLAPRERRNRAAVGGHPPLFSREEERLSSRSGIITKAEGGEFRETLQDKFHKNTR